MGVVRRVMDRFISKGDRDIGGGRIFDGPELRQLWYRARALLTSNPKDPEKTFTLEVRPEEVKVLYARVLALQSLVDGRLDPREIEYLYVFMSRIGLSSDSRDQVRQALATKDVSPADVVRLVEEVISAVPDNPEEIAASMIKDMVQVSRADNVVLPQEQASIELAAEAHFGERAPRVIELAEKTVKYEEALIDGKVSVGELETQVKEIVAVATAASVPITALFFSGSVVGLSAAGITSGLAALGLGGLLGLSAMVTGIGTVVVIGVTAYAATRWVLGGKDRELARQREHMIQQIIKSHQGAIEDLAEDQSAIALKLAEYVSRSDQNEARLARLKDELQMFTAALAELRQEKDNMQAQSA
jgi:Tellurite resistance protein TerB